MGEKGFFDERESHSRERMNRRRISAVFETDDYQEANRKLREGWDVLKAIISNGRSFYILVRYEEKEKCEGS